MVCGLVRGRHDEHMTICGVCVNADADCYNDTCDFMWYVCCAADADCSNDT